MEPISIGARGSAQTVADASKLANAVGSGSLPVLATPLMTALMEAAACDAVAAYLEPTETTVGTALHITHDAATPQGMTVRAEAEVTGVNGREISFAVTAYDEAGQIGTGTHKRFLVEQQRFLDKAAKRGQQ